MKESAELASRLVQAALRCFRHEGDFTLKPDARIRRVKIDQAKFSMEGMGDEQPTR